MHDTRNRLIPLSNLRKRVCQNFNKHFSASPACIVPSPNSNLSKAYLVIPGYYLGVAYNPTEIQSRLRLRGGAHRQVAERCRIFQNASDIKKKMNSGTYGVFVRTLTDGQLYSCDPVREFASSFRVMKADVSTLYVSYAFQKDSPYTTLFNYYIFRLSTFFLIKIPI